MLNVYQPSPQKDLYHDNINTLNSKHICVCICTYTFSPQKRVIFLLPPSQVLYLLQSYLIISFIGVLDVCRLPSKHPCPFPHQQPITLSVWNAPLLPSQFYCLSRMNPSLPIGISSERLKPISMCQLPGNSDWFRVEHMTQCRPLREKETQDLRRR